MNLMCINYLFIQVCKINIIHSYAFSHRDHSRAFRITGPNEWNKLTFYLRLIINTLSFKAKLKTYLFSID